MQMSKRGVNINEPRRLIDERSLGKLGWDDERRENGPV